MRNDDGNLGPAGTAPTRSTATPRRRPRGRAIAGLAISVGLVATACTSGSDEPEAQPSLSPPPAGTAAGLTGEAADFRARMLKLSAYDSCDALLDDFRKAALSRAAQPPVMEAAGQPAPGAGDRPDGDSGKAGAAEAPNAAAPQDAASGARAPGDGSTAAPGYSGTNVQEQGVDEPDLVKTDGRRVVTVADGTLRVLDAATRAQTGKLALPGGRATEMLLSGDRALVIMPNNQAVAYDQPSGGSERAPSRVAPSSQSKLVLVDLSGQPRVLGELAVDGSYVDARQIGATARVVIRSHPRGPVVDSPGGKDYKSQYTKAVNKTTVDDWLPGYTLKNGDRTSTGRLVECGNVSRPDTEAGAPGHSGASTVSVLSFDLARDLDTGSPVTVAADADTVYASSGNLYVAANYYPYYGAKSKSSVAQMTNRTAVYQFDISGTAQPRHVASGDVEGQLLNQYSMSEYDNHLRIATTLQRPPGATAQPKSGNSGSSGPFGSSGSGNSGSDSVAAPEVAPVAATESAVAVLKRNGTELVEVGRVGGLGRGERIYAVRFTGAVGYVVTFRRTDPLYTLDLANPAAPKVLGELKINGYSAYLHPVDGGKLIGVGQDATDTGRRLGTQVSLFDVTNLTAPTRIANHTVSQGNSEAEMDPHAFLYWPSNGTVVIPLQTGYGTTTRPGTPPSTGSTGSSGTGSSGSTGAVAPDYAPARTQALVLRLQGASFVEVGRISHPSSALLRRSLVIGDTLWTVSAGGVMVNDLDDLEQRAWVPFV
ncbi:beta-propeller domain-containing protein [Yinghuangia sp. YIM S09857]|uniref:beta-propeller domain-containing protein n=1 Tax=Yinghuangia sp. YIM S09857 TaxID=3436929 RepID=UPI003F52AC21